MKSLLVSYSDFAGGAARATYRIHQALGANGIESALVVRKKLSNDETVFRMRAPDLGRIAPRLGTYIQKLQRTENPVTHSSNFLPTRWAPHLKADVVNLHWIGTGTMSVADVGRIEPPVVMTMHDMWGFCGAEHYAPDEADARWISGYSRDNRPEGHRGLDLDRWTWQRKRHHWKQMTVVTPSQWLADCARRSSLMSQWPVYVVPYPIDVSLFRPQDRAYARKELSLPMEARVILFGAMGGGKDPRKGFDLLFEALRKLDAPSGAIGVGFGQEDLRIPSGVQLPIRWTGVIKSDKALAALYSAADVMVVPSRQEAFGQTASEAQTCGTPVVAFGASGLTSVVDHGTTGYLAEHFSPESLATGISWTLEDADRRARLGHAARERAVRLWNPSVVARQYQDVYLEAVDRHRCQGTAV